MTAFDEEAFEKKLLGLKDTHESISSLSQWCLDRPQHHKKIVSFWLQILKKVKIEQRLTLFYLANDVIQYSKRKGYDFVESWGTALQKATTMVRDDKVKNKILRLFKIWDERSIYDEAFLADLSGLLSSRKPAQGKDEAQDFQPSNLISKIRSCKNLEDDTDAKRKIVNDSHLSLNDADSLRSFLKDRRHGADLEQELEEGVDKMVMYISALKTEITERKTLIETLELSETFYENQRGEAKIVCNAYRNFSKRVENLKKKLDELTETLPSPMPSPDVNAPSPSPESDIDLPDDDVTPGTYSVATSFMGKLVVPENVTNPSEAIYSLTDSPPRKLNYKPPTPPRSFKRKSSPKPYHSPPPTTYISSTTPTLSSSSASNYSSGSPYQPVAKPVYTPNTTSYSSSYSVSYPNTTSSTNTNYYNPEENDQLNSYDSNTASQDSYHVPGANPPAPALYLNAAPPTDYAMARNPSPTYPADPVPPHRARNPSPTYPADPAPPHRARKYPPSRGRYDEPPPVAPPPDYSVPPPTTDDYRPFYSTNNLTIPPLLGEDCPPTNVNGLDSFLQAENSGNEEPPKAPPLLGSGSGFSSFMGNLNLPFDFQKGLFSESCDDTPSSPPPETLDDNTSHYFSDSNQEGKPIEVINRTKQPDLSEILKAISMQPPPGPRGGGGGDMELSSPSPTLPPPPLPPSALEEGEGRDKPWSQPPLLPPKFPTWGQDNEWPDTPASPPLYEKAGFGEPVEFEESDSLALGDTDTDLRSLGLQGDIDHRNLISLTSSPRDENPWASNQDTDYRKMVLAPKRTVQDVNVESVDMEMSSDEEGMETDATKTPTSVCFSLTTNAKPLADSPLKEKEEPKKKLLCLTLTPPPRLPEPPPLPDVDEIFPPELDETRNTKLTPPPIPPPVPPILVQPIPTLQEPNANFPPPQRGRGFFGPRFNNQRQRFPQWQNNPGNNNINNNQNSPRPRQPPLTGPRFRPDGNFRGRPPWFRGNRPPRFAGCRYPQEEFPPDPQTSCILT